jgi:hypothetical protein
MKFLSFAFNALVATAFAQEQNSMLPDSQIF